MLGLRETVEGGQCAATLGYLDFLEIYRGTNFAYAVDFSIYVPLFLIQTFSEVA